MRPGGYAPHLSTHPLLVGRPLRLLYRRGSTPQTFVPDERSIFRGTTWMGLEASPTPSFGVTNRLCCVVNDGFQGSTPGVQTKIGFQYPNRRCGAADLFLGTNGRLAVSGRCRVRTTGFPGLTPRVGLLHLDKEAFHLRTLWRIRRKPPEKFLGRCGGVAAPALARERDCQGKPRLMRSK